MRVTALIPAHNEEATVAATIRSLQAQTLPPSRILVVADNCTDHTPLAAADAGAEVLLTRFNSDRKAGALNQALPLVTDELVLVMDADSELSPTFLEGAVARLTGDPSLGAVGCLFYGRNERTLVQAMQANEYHRYCREISRRKGMKLNVLTGAGAVFRTDVLHEVNQARCLGILPGQGFYQQTALTEDNELTLAVQTLGYRCVTDARCTLRTDLPATWSELKTQRLRWRNGAMENLRDYGLTRVTAIHAVKMVWSLIATIAFWLYLAMVSITVAEGHNPLAWSWLWTPLLGLYVLDRLVSVRGRPTKGVLVALVLPLEILYDIFQQYVLILALYKAITRSSVSWR